MEYGIFRPKINGIWDTCFPAPAPHSDGAIKKKHSVGIIKPLSPRSGSVALQLYCLLWSYGSLARLQTVKSFLTDPRALIWFFSRSGPEMLVLFMPFMFMQASLQFCEGTYTDDEGKHEGKFQSDKTTQA